VSARSRAEPWFRSAWVGRQWCWMPPVLVWRRIVDGVPQWSWDGVTWFNARGECVYEGSSFEYRMHAGWPPGVQP
jgi:hypothetical protein